MLFNNKNKNINFQYQIEYLEKEKNIILTIKITPENYYVYSSFEKQNYCKSIIVMIYNSETFEVYNAFIENFENINSKKNKFKVDYVVDFPKEYLEEKHSEIIITSSWKVENEEIQEELKINSLLKN